MLLICLFHTHTRGGFFCVDVGTSVSHALIQESTATPVSSITMVAVTPLPPLLPADLHTVVKVTI